jgi:cellulose biosynthesis protein BcsQ
MSKHEFATPSGFSTQRIPSTPILDPLRNAGHEERILIISIASMKGGVGKTTISALLARRIADQRRASILVIDMDPQRGASILLLGPELGTRIQPPTIYDVLANCYERDPPLPAIEQAIRRSPYHEDIYVLPATGELGALTRTDAPASLLKKALAAYPLSKDLLVILDSSSNHVLCEMCLAASDHVFIPATFSHQSALPTINTIKTCLIRKTRVRGLIPVMTGKAAWQEAQIEAWRVRLKADELLKALKTEVLPAMPFSQAIVRGRWRWGKIPPRFYPTLDGIVDLIFADPAWTRRHARDRMHCQGMLIDEDEGIST